MRVIVALLLKKIPRQYFQYREWTYKKENYTKRPKFFHYSSNEHDVNNHSCIEKKCKDSLKAYLYPSKCIVYSRPYKANFEYYSLKPLYSKPKEFIRRLGGADVSQILGQQKLIRD